MLLWTTAPCPRAAAWPGPSWPPKFEINWSSVLAEVSSTRTSKPLSPSTSMSRERWVLGRDEGGRWSRAEPRNRLVLLILEGTNVRGVISKGGEARPKHCCGRGCRQMTWSLEERWNSGSWVLVGGSGSRCCWHLLRRQQGMGWVLEVLQTAQWLS